VVEQAEEGDPIVIATQTRGGAKDQQDRQSDESCGGHPLAAGADDALVPHAATMHW